MITLRNLGIGTAIDAELSKTVFKDLRSTYTIGQVSAPGLGVAATFDVAVDTTSGVTKVLKGVSKVGVCSIGLTGYDIYKDSQVYSGGDLAIAAAIDAGSAALIAIGTGAAVGAGAPVIAIVVGGVLVGYLVNQGTSYVKDRYLTRSN
jgi:hypothetical protein